MRHISLTPFGRQTNMAAHLAAQALAEAPAPSEAPDKWAVLRDLTAARAAYGVSDRDLAVLAALLSFHPHTRLADDDALIVFPSNAALSERAHGMADSTLRRHLSALVRAGLLVRHDSPNGKRYALRDGHGGVRMAFGLDLRPLLVRAEEIVARATAARAAETERKRLRERAVIALRDAAALAEWGNVTERFVDAFPPLRRALRRRLEGEALAALAEDAETLREQVRKSLIVSQESEKSSGNDGDFGRHQHNSKTDTYESEPCYEKREAEAEAREVSDDAQEAGTTGKEIAIPLGLVTKAAPDIVPYAAAGEIRNWRDLFAAAETVRPMMGISPDAWAQAQKLMGPEVAAIVLACILQNVVRIRSPGGYLRALSNKAAEAQFSPGPMVMALLRRDEARAV